MPIKIYKIDASPPCRAVFMILDILKLEYETQEVNTLAGEQMKPEYLEKNPLHKVPIIEDRGFILADSHAIITYLVSKYGADKRGELYPSDLALRATIDQRLFFDATILFPSLAPIVVGIVLEKLTEPSEAHIAAVENGYAVLEKYLEANKFVACEYLTLADVSIVATVSSLAALVPIDAKFKKVTAWFEKIKEEEWYQKANVPGLTDFANLLHARMEQNKE